MAGNRCDYLKNLKAVKKAFQALKNEKDEKEMLQKFRACEVAVSAFQGILTNEQKKGIPRRELKIAGQMVATALAVMAGFVVGALAGFLYAIFQPGSHELIPSLVIGALTGLIGAIGFGKATYDDIKASHLTDSGTLIDKAEKLKTHGLFSVNAKEGEPGSGLSEHLIPSNNQRLTGDDLLPDQRLHTNGC